MRGKGLRARNGLLAAALVVAGFAVAVATAGAAPVGQLSFADCHDDDESGPETSCVPADGLAGVLSVAISPDGRSLYAATNGDHAIVRFNRNTTTGALSFAQCVDDDESGVELACAGVDGLEEASSVAISPDGRSLYAAGFQDDAIVRFDRNTLTGALAFAECIDDNDTGTEAACPGVDGLAGVLSVAVSPDGRSLYAASQADHAIVRFNRNTTTGALSLAQCIDDDEMGAEAACPGADGLAGAFSVAASPDGRSLYAASEADDAIVRFDRDPTTGALFFAGCIDDNDTGTEAACPGADGLDSVVSVAVSPDGRSLYAASALDDAIVRFNRNSTTGAISFAQCIDDNETDSEPACPGVDGLDGAASVAASPDGRSLYASSGGDSAIVRFDRNMTTGALSFGQCVDDNSGTEAACPGVAGLEIANLVALSPEGRSLYAASGFFTVGDNAVVRFDREPLRCRGRKATRVGTVLAETIRGTAGADVIVSQGGNDTIIALGGRDHVCAGAGRDTLRGGKGRDRLLGEAGNDALLGQAGNDVLIGGKGRDRLIGGPGRDTQRQ
jgi:6-phosphogluconolactonase (cycloisomerase 2 family)